MFTTYSIFSSDLLLFDLSVFSLRLLDMPGDFSYQYTVVHSQQIYRDKKCEPFDFLFQSSHWV